MKFYLLVSGFCFSFFIPSNCSTREGKFIAALVSFPNDQCTTMNGTGVCLHKKKCARSGGINLGTCAQGYGQCCQYTAQCTTSDSVTVTRNHTTLLSPSYLPKTCTFMFPRQAGVCQLRLDFPKFRLSGAGSDGICFNDSLTVSGTVTVKGLNICGINASAANHMYLDYGTSDGPILIRIKTVGNMHIMDYGYEIRVTQIMCTSALRVPQDCLQYHRNQSGFITSFNYDQQQLNSQNYKICVEKQSQDDRLQWSLCNKMDPLPIFSNDICIKGEDCLHGGGTPICNSDYLEVPGSALSRYCDISQFGRYPAITTENFWMRVNMDDKELQTMPPFLEPRNESCQSFDPADYPKYDLVDLESNGGCFIKQRTVDTFNKGFCLAYTVV